jgi:hypothetical protein
MPAPITSLQSQDLTVYQTQITYLMAILDNEANLGSDRRTITADNITKINETLAQALDNTKAIFVDAAPEAH